MILYKGSKLHMNPFKPQPVHPDDYYKFPEPKPENVIFASESETKAKIFATFSTIIPFRMETYRDKPQKTVITDLPLDIKLEEKIYIYKFDSDKQGWKYIENSREWYNTKEQIPLEIKKYTREGLYNELKENTEISFIKGNPLEEDPFPIS